MKLLQELQSIDTLELSHNQQGTLAIIVASASPKSAFDSTSGAESLDSSRKMLDKLGFITVGDDTIDVTTRGKKASITYNIQDADGSMTDTGKALINDMLDDKHSWKITD